MSRPRHTREEVDDALEIIRGPKLAREGTTKLAALVLASEVLALRAIVDGYRAPLDPIKTLRNTESASAVYAARDLLAAFEGTERDEPDDLDDPDGFVCGNCDAEFSGELRSCPECGWHVGNLDLQFSVKTTDPERVHGFEITLGRGTGTDAITVTLDRLGDMTDTDALDAIGAHVMQAAAQAWADLRAGYNRDLRAIGPCKACGAAAVSCGPALWDVGRRCCDACAHAAYTGPTIFGGFGRGTE
jgi:hypothetical protein